MNQSTEPNLQMPTDVRRGLLYGTGCAYELTKWIIVFIVLITLVNFFVATVAIVDGISMEPNFHTGQYLIINRWQYNFGKPARGDAVVLKFPGDPEKKKYIKRIVGLPGDRVQIQNGGVYINGQRLVEPYIPTYVATTADHVINYVVPEGEYFVCGDNRPNSNDSRIWGTAAARFLIGKAEFVIFPKFEVIPEQKY